MLDWHTKGLTGPVRQQRQCSVCWALLATGVIEPAMAIKKRDALPPPECKARLALGHCMDNLKLVVPLGEQDLINCTSGLRRGVKAS
jgi:hypothetical protein